MMQQVLYYTLFCCCVLLGLKQQANAQDTPIHIQHQAKDFFVAGVNLPWNNFGWDFGEHHEWGVGYNPNFFEEAFTELAAHHVNTVRVWLHCDGRGNPEFNEDGFVTGLDDNFFEHLDDMIARAAAHDIQLIMCLWSFDLTKDYTDGAGQYAGNHQDLLTNMDKTNSYINHALIPIIERYQYHENILAWEIMNEPEWSMKIDGAGNVAPKVTGSAMQRFIGSCAAAIHQVNDQQKVTVGSASIKWNCDLGGRLIEGNLWSDKVFKELGLDPDFAYLDFYTIHYYDWMKKKLSPCIYDITHWKLDKPVLIGEAPAREDEKLSFSVYEQLHSSFHRGYAGIAFWSYNANDGHGNWNAMKDVLKDFGELQPVRVDRESFGEEVHIYPNPTQGTANITLTYEKLNHVKIRVLDMLERPVYQNTIPLVEGFHQEQIPNLASGFYLVRITNDIYAVHKKMVVH